MDAFLGEIRIFAGNFAPVNWEFCAGKILPIANNEALYSLIGTTYGGDGRSTFQLPDYRGRIVAGQGTGPGLSPRVLAQRFGSPTVTLTADTMPTHNHPLHASSAAAGTDTNPTGRILAKGTPTYYTATADANTDYPADAIQHFGGDQPHENMMPYMAINHIICVYGIFPPQA
jgi:microcystin-dependent protein